MCLHKQKPLVSFTRDKQVTFRVDTVFTVELLFILVKFKIDM